MSAYATAAKSKGSEKIRRRQGRCSRLMHELCYATSPYPDRAFRFGGTIISNADVGYRGLDAEHARNQIANIHGGMVKLGEQWYISYHRHTHGRQFSRQGCMEPITIGETGAIAQVECTSFGLSGGKASAKEPVPAWCACNLYKGQGGVFIRFSRERTVDAPFVVVKEEGYVTNITDTGVVGFRYLTFDGSESRLTLRVRGRCEGTLSVYLSNENSAPADGRLPEGVKKIRLKDTFGLHCELFPQVEYVRWGDDPLHLEFLAPRQHPICVSLDGQQANVKHTGQLDKIGASIEINGNGMSRRDAPWHTFIPLAAFLRSCTPARIFVRALALDTASKLAIIIQSFPCSTVRGTWAVIPLTGRSPKSSPARSRRLHTGRGLNTSPV